MRGRKEKHPFQGWLNVGAEFSVLYFSVSVCKSMIKMCDALAYHMEGAEKHLSLISALYNFLTKALLIFKKEPSVYLYSYISNMSFVFI